MVGCLYQRQDSEEKCFLSLSSADCFFLYSWDGSGLWSALHVSHFPAAASHHSVAFIRRVFVITCNLIFSALSQC